MLRAITSVRKLCSPYFSSTGVFYSKTTPPKKLQLIYPNVEVRNKENLEIEKKLKKEFGVTIDSFEYDKKAGLYVDAKSRGQRLVGTPQEILVPDKGKIIIPTSEEMEYLKNMEKLGGMEYGQELERKKMLLRLLKEHKKSD